MLVFTSAKEMRQWSRQQRCGGETIGFVPTMGYLHHGHMSLVEAVKSRCSVIVVSIYVNPTQFAAHEDFDTYPRDVEGDRKKLRDAGVAAVFEPVTLYAGAASDGGMVVGRAGAAGSGGHDTFVHPERMQRPLCGASRPHFFRGVATVVTKLFNIVDPDVAAFGRKDYQQWRIVCALARDLDFAVDVVGVDISREADGVAASSRNARLTREARAAAPCIHAALQWAKEAAGAGAGRAAAGSSAAGATAAEVEDEVRRRIEHGGGRVDYVEVVHAQHLSRVEQVCAQPSVCAVAAFFPAQGGGDVRLIDNMVLHDGPAEVA